MTENDQRAMLQAQMERWVGTVRAQVQTIEKAVGKSSLTVDEAAQVWGKLRLNAIQAVDAMVGHATTQRGREPSCPTCVSGMCCNSRVDVVLMDAVPIIQGLEESGGLTDDFLRTCRERNRAELMAGRPDVWIRKQTPCLFLRGGRCSVYAARPVPCIQFYVWSDPVYCTDMDPAGLEALVSPPQKMLHIALGGLMDRLVGTYDIGFLGTTLPGALWVMGTAWPLRADARAFRREVRKLTRKVMLSRRNSA